jgi:hypothetical protein
MKYILHILRSFNFWDQADIFNIDIMAAQLRQSSL